MKTIKRIIIGIFLITIFADAKDFVFEVSSPDVVNAYLDVFNGIVKIITSKDYVSLLRLVFVLGAFFVFLQGVLTSWSKGGQGALGGLVAYLVMGVILLTVFLGDQNSKMIVHTNNIATICDNPDSSSTSGGEVGNFPTILGYTFKALNQIGKKMQDLAETAYTPADSVLTIEKQNGYIGALKNSLDILSIDIDKVSLAQDKNGTKNPYPLGMEVKTLLAQCILIPFSANGLDGMKLIAELKSSPNIAGYFKYLYDSNGTVKLNNQDVGEFEATLGGETYKCKDIYNLLKPYLKKFGDDAKCSVNATEGAVKLLVGNVSGDVQSKFSEIAIQAGLVGALADTTKQLGIGSDGVAYASGKTRAEFVQSNMASGLYMAQMLPYLQMTIRAVLYAFFPMVFVIILLPGGLKVLTQYFQALLWIELWGPTAAVLNLFIEKHAEKLYTHQPLTLMTSLDMLSSGSTMAGVAGYLYMSVPALTWLILKGSAYMLAGIGGAIATNMSKNLDTATTNQDVRTMAATETMKLETGEDISIAEEQHFEAVQTGTSTGATLGVDKRKGLKAVGDAAVFNEVKRLTSTKEAMNRMGGSASVAGSEIGEVEGKNQAIQGMSYGSFNETVKTEAISSDIKEEQGKLLASANTNDISSTTRASVRETSIRDNIARTKAYNEVVGNIFGGSYYKYHQLNYGNQVAQLKMTAGQFRAIGVNTEDGLSSSEASKAKSFGFRKGVIDLDHLVEAETKYANVSPEEAGLTAARSTLSTSAQQKAWIKLARHLGYKGSDNEVLKELKANQALTSFTYTDPEKGKVTVSYFKDAQGNLRKVQLSYNNAVGLNEKPEWTMLRKLGFKPEEINKINGMKSVISTLSIIRRHPVFAAFLWSATGIKSFNEKMQKYTREGMNKVEAMKRAIEDMFEKYKGTESPVDRLYKQYTSVN